MFKRFTATVMAALLLGTLTVGAAEPVASADESQTAVTEPESAAGENTGDSEESKDYSAYLESILDKPDAVAEAEADAGDVADSKNTSIEEIDGSRAAKTEENGWVEFAIKVPRDGVYNIHVEYYNTPGKNAAIERELLIDGQLPFSQANAFIFKRVWKDAVEYNNGFTFDKGGNEIRPAQEEVCAWRSQVLYDTLGYVAEPYRFYLTAGDHTIRFNSVSEPMAIRKVRLTAPQKLPTYEEKLAEYEGQGYKEVEAGDIVIRQAENSYQKSDRTLVPIFDRTSAATQPFSPEDILLNTIGSTSWKYPGDWISWEIEVEESGLYRIGFRERQNQVSGQFVTRRLYVNGEVPFDEANYIQFSYNSAWKVQVAGDGEREFLFYLEAGKPNIITMEATLGKFADILKGVEESVYNLNYVYRQILMITGADPDPNRDYNLDIVLPHCMDILAEESARLKDIVQEIADITGNKGNYTSTLERMSVRIDNMLKQPERIPGQYNDFKESIVAMGSWILTAKEQPLELDYIMALNKSNSLPKANANFFEAAWAQIQMLVASFTKDYNMMTTDQEVSQSIDVWIATGRDQANTINRLAANDFTPKSGIGVNLKLVTAGSLLPAILAGKGPDVSLSAAANEPINYAMRKAVTALNDFDGFEDIKSQFYDSALVPYTFDGKLYALPETQSFPMLFYRTDILEELGITELDTWDDIQILLTELQKKNMQFGLPSNLSSYYTFLFQNGGAVYTDDAKKMALDSDAGVNSFKQWTNYYTSYRVPITYDFATRFRIGEIPVGIADYTTFNLLSVFAPEIKGMWGFTHVPGTVQEDGSVDYSVAGTGVATILLATSQKQEAAWEFMKWWASASAQVQYGQEMESLLGTSARYAAANKEAIGSLPWSYKDYTALQEQWPHVVGVPEVPGSYLLDREINFAFRQVVLQSGNPREALADHLDNINLEITKKRKEFGLET